MTTSPTNKRPTHTAYIVRDYAAGEKSDAFWLPVGAAWAHRDGNGFDIQLDALPTGGRLTLRKNKPKQ